MKLLYLLFLFVFNSYTQVDHLKDATKEFKKKLQNLASYYEQGDYEKELQAICKSSLSNLYNPDNNSVIIFDIDETALTDYYFFKSQNFDWTIEDAFQFRKSSTSAAIKPVFDFYTAVRNLGFKVIFITSRRSTLQEATEKNLQKEGYTDYEQLILLPIELFNAGVKHEEWKAEKRAELAQKYNIVASISDSDKDFEGGNTGFKIKLPNYLY
ncbi:MAG: HAD family acid phosphatase [Candidatus Babeliales bacterium]|nr:HAD family acid phosphatase [Candidatus Babeliales bacterium]